MRRPGKQISTRARAPSIHIATLRFSRSRLRRGVAAKPSTTPTPQPIMSPEIPAVSSSQK